MNIMAGAVSGNRIRELRVERRLTQEELAHRLGGDTAVATISRLESGRMMLTTKWLDRLADALSVTPHDIIASPHHRLRMVPVISLAAVGNWSEEIISPAAWMPVLPEVGGPNCFALQVAGDCLKKIADPGSYLIVDPDQRELIDGKVYIIQDEHEQVTFKRFGAAPPRLEPLSDNPGDKTVSIGREPFIVIARVTRVTSVV